MIAWMRMSIFNLRIVMGRAAQELQHLLGFDRAIQPGDLNCLSKNIGNI